MSDGQEPSEIHPSDFLADVALRLMERDMLAKDGWRVAFAVAGLLDSLAEVAKRDESPELADFAHQSILDMVNTLLYAHVHLIPTDQDIDSQAKEFSDLFDRAEEFRKNKNEEEGE